MAMIVMNSSSTDSHKCVMCGKKTGNSYVYCERGLEVNMPICAKCMKTRTDSFYQRVKRMMSFRISEIKTDINTYIQREAQAGSSTGGAE